MTSPLVTVYITNYNYGRYVETAIRSVLGQTFGDYELLVIDDGSTDGSRDVILGFEAHPRVRLIFQDNLGLNRTNNVALRAARGKYIMRLDADDYLDPNALLVLTSEMERDDSIAMVFPDFYYIDAAGTITGQERRHDFAKDVSLFDRPANGACTMFRVQALRSVSGYSELYECQDGYDIWLKLLGRYRIRNVNLPLFYYRRHSANLTGRDRLILDTRAEIKRAHAAALGRPPLRALAVIAERGRRGDPASQALSPFGDRVVIDWTIDAALAVAAIERIVVSTPDEEIIDHVTARYGGRVDVQRRDIGLAVENVSVDRTIEQAIAVGDPERRLDAYVALFAPFPLRSATTIETALNTMRIFDVDSVVGVVPESDIFFRHTGHGLELVGDSCQFDSLRLERDFVYRMSGGLQVVSAAFYRKHRQRMGGRIGHVVLDELASTRVADAASLRRLELRLAADATPSGVV